MAGNLKDPEAVALNLRGAYVIKPAIFPDERGEFAVLFSNDTLSKMGVKPHFEMEFVSTSKNGVLRGMHFQSGAAAQAKLVRCIRGEVFDAIVDLRRGSKTFGKWEGVLLSENNKQAIYVPKGFAHGYLSLSEQSQVLYKVDAPYAPKSERGLRYDDKTVGIKWPAEAAMVSERDMALPGFDACEKFD